VIAHPPEDAERPHGVVDQALLDGLEPADRPTERLDLALVGIGA